MAAAGEWVVWFNGKRGRAGRAGALRDRGFKYGDAVFDTTRTFGHRIFRLDEHLDRFFRSLAYLDIDPDLSKKQFREITEQVAAHNLKLTPPGRRHLGVAAGDMRAGAVRPRRPIRTIRSARSSSNAGRCRSATGRSSTATGSS